MATSSIEVIVRVKSVDALEKILPALDKINKDDSLYVKIRVEATVKDFNIL